MQKITRLILLAVLGTSCSQLYYSVWEAMGKEKKDLLRDEVQQLKSDQESVNQELEDALTRLRTLYSIPASELAEAYDKLRNDYVDAKQRSAAFDKRLKQVQTVASDLFHEWEQEIEKLKTPRYKSDSQQKLRTTRQKYAKLESLMLNAQKDLKPVLSSLEEQVIYLKHNLNAQALGSLKGEIKSLETEMKLLKNSIEKSTNESQKFLDKLIDK